MEPVKSRLRPELVRLGLEDYVLALEVDGLAVVPPEVHGGRRRSRGRSWTSSPGCRPVFS